MDQPRIEPAIVSPSREAAVPAGSGTAPPSRRMFSSDAPAGPDLIGTSGILDHFAELATLKGTETPISLGLFGGPGSGKSHALRGILERVRQLASAARAASGAGPFLAAVVPVRISATALQASTAPTLASAIYDALSADPAAPPAWASLAQDAVHAATDPTAAARGASERLDATRRQLDAERRTLDDLEGRSARLADTVLYEAAGSRVDAYARSHRSSIEAALRAFGFAGEPIQTFKDLVRDYAEQSGAASRMMLVLRSLWAFKGQTALIVWAIILFLVAWGLGVAAGTSTEWLPALRSMGDWTASVVTWMQGHLGWLGPMRQAAIVLAILCLVRNLWRAGRFVSPIMRGASLLRTDTESRRRELDTQRGHQIRRVDALTAEVNAHARRLEHAERRMRETGRQANTDAHDHPFALKNQRDPERDAMDFVTALTRAMGRTPDAPQRLVVAIDDLEQVSPEVAGQIIATAQRLLAAPGVVTILALDPDHLVPSWGGRASVLARLERYVQIPLAVDTLYDASRLVEFTRGLVEEATAPEARAIDASRSALDEPLQDAERDLLARLTVLAGSTPRMAKRFVNLYRLARQSDCDRAALALMLALDLGGTSGELSAMAAALDERAPESEIHIHPGEARLAQAVAEVSGSSGRPLTAADAQAAWSVARSYRIPV